MQLSVKAVFALQATQEGKTKIAAQMVEHPVNHDLKVSQEVTAQFKEQVRVIAKKFAYFRAKIVEFTVYG